MVFSISCNKLINMHMQRKDSDVFPNILFKEYQNCFEISGYCLANNLIY